MKRFRLVVLSLTAALGAFGLASRHVANAGSASQNLTVSATVVASCTIATNAVTFTGYDPVNVNLTTPFDSSTGSLVVACTNGTTATIGLGQGSNPLGTSTASVPLRQMASGTNRLGYFLFQDAARTITWGDINLAVPTAAVTYNATTAAPQTFTVYGRINAAQDVAVGSYTDTVVATVQF
ncbi:MAG TPA: spore coat U domain-containing protein [Polyangia bacterium]|nr:spore coat U domain-containing protein [Polyangia bacterium]